MNKSRREFLERNKDPSVKNYLLGKEHDPVTHFKYYWANAKNKTIILLPYRNKVWNEDKLVLSSINDLEFFKQFYQDKRNVLVTLDERK